MVANVARCDCVRVCRIRCQVLATFAKGVMQQHRQVTVIIVLTVAASTSSHLDSAALAYAVKACQAEYSFLQI